MENETENNESAKNSQTDKTGGERVDPILTHLSVPDVDLDKNKIRDSFIQLWEFEEAEKYSPETQFLTAIGIFMYVTHNYLDELNIRIDRAREYIVEALRKWREPDLEKALAVERSSDNPFKTFVDNELPKIDEIYTWENFLLEHKQADGNKWTYKMRKCWFATFFIRFGRTDYIQTGCLYDQIPWEARKDYVDLKLNNLFVKLGNICQFNYTPAKKDS